MDEKEKTNLRKFFSTYSAIFSVIYCIYIATLIFSLPFSTPLFAFLTFIMFFLFIVQNAINEKVEELGDIGAGRLLSLPFFTGLIVLYYAVMVFYLETKEVNTVLWAVLALYDSVLLDKSLRAWRKLKQS